jgi:hypothetical protein
VVRLNLARGLQIACVLALVAVILIIWSVLDPTPIPVIVSMSLGQAIGTISFAIYGFIVFVDFRRAVRSRRSVLAPPSGQFAAVKPPADLLEPTEGEQDAAGDTPKNGAGAKEPGEPPAGGESA